MIVAKVTSKGQVTIPKKVRERLGIHPGEQVGFEEKGDLVLIKKALTQSPFDQWVGKLKHLKGRHSDDLVREIRGHDNGHIILDVLIPGDPFNQSSKTLLEKQFSKGKLIICEIVLAELAAQFPSESDLKTL